MHHRYAAAFLRHRMEPHTTGYTVGYGLKGLTVEEEGGVVVKVLVMMEPTNA